MNQAFLQVVQNFPLEEKLELLRFLLDSIEAANGEFLPTSECLIVRKRFERMQNNPKPAKPWREFLQGLG